MNQIQLTLNARKTSDGLAYQHLIGLKLPKEMRSNQGVILEGKAPIWLYGYLVHECPPLGLVATIRV
jgi:CRISPR-associated protein Csx3